MNEEQIPSQNIPNATLSLLFSGLSLFLFVLLFVFGFKLAAVIPCLQGLLFPSESWLVGIIGFSLVYLPSFLAILLSFLEKMSGNIGRVLIARLISIALCGLYLSMSFWLFLVFYWVDAPVSC